MKHTFDEQLQISQFIKDPGSLKLLILAGTNIRSNELITVNKCISLIKLDLSSNQLIEIPLKFNNFNQMKILYLHDNQITSISIIKTNLQYVSLFDNPIKNYRNSLIESNQKLMAVDHYVITQSQRLYHTTPHPFSILKWPIVEISQSLQHQQDYLNLLKAQLFVVNQVYKRANFADIINKYFLAFKEIIRYNSIKHTVTNQAFFRKQFMKNTVDHWIIFTEKKKKLRKLFSGTKSQYLLLNKLQRIKMGRSPGVSRVLQRFLNSVRQRMRARKVLQRSLSVYRSHIPVYKILLQGLLKQPLKLYFKQSQAYFLEKIFLYSKKIFFNLKQYDILDHFDQLVVKSKKSYYIYRNTSKSSQSILMDMVKNAMGLVIGQKGLDRRSYLYNRQGHRRIQIKRVRKINEKYDKIKFKKTCDKIERIYNSYDLLVQYTIKNEQIYQNLMRIIKYFNAGNSQFILQNQAAYFQTEVVFQDKKVQKRKQKIFFSCYFYIRRVISANIIQKWWRKIKTIKKCQINIIQKIRVKRANNLIGRWLRDLTFRHRLQISKHHSFMKSTFKQCELVLQLDIYMNLPIPKNLLRIKGDAHGQKTQQYLYEILHKNTQIEIIDTCGRSWIKIRFLSSQQAYEVQKQLSIVTYRYYFNGIFIKLFNLNEVNHIKDILQYENKIKKLYNIDVNISDNNNKITKKIQIDNSQPYFIWPYLQEGFASMFKSQEIQSLPISVFIYNKNRRPLKVNCDLMWINPLNIYYFRKRVKPMIRVRTPKKQKVQVQSGLEHYLPHIRHKMNRERQFSVKQHKSLLQANRQRGNSQHVQLTLLSQTLNIKKQ